MVRLICPRCGSRSVFDDSTQLGVHEWCCLDCGEMWWSGSVPHTYNIEAEADYGSLEVKKEEIG